jgi:hypothetical protein
MMPGVMVMLNLEGEKLHLVNIENISQRFLQEEANILTVNCDL